jgi:hypothetical protein
MEVAMSHRLAVLSLVCLFSGSAALAVMPAPPDVVSYSGVANQAGPFDVTARIYDAASGGTLVYKQTFTNVSETALHFTLQLGPTGDATDAPANPLTTSLRTALTGDLAAGAGRFVEITLDAGPPLARVQLVLVPYAMRADHATTADVAAQSLDTQAVSGLDGAALEALYQVYNDDGGPPSTDPREGTGDTDGDGLANFVDADNDDDTLTDSQELTLGTELNLLTPRITSLVPDNGPGDVVTQVTVNGTGFAPGLTAQFGAQSTPVSNLTPTSFLTDVGPHPGPSFPVAVDLTVTNANGESDALGAAFVFGPPAGGGVTVTPLPWTLANATLPIGIVTRGEEVLVWGTQANGQNRYAADTITDGNLAFDVNQSLSGRLPSAVSWSPSRVISGLRILPANNKVQFGRDVNDDKVIGTSEAVTIEVPTPGGTPFTRSPSLVFDGSGRPGGAYLLGVGSATTARAFHDRNGDGVFTGANEVVTIEPIGTPTDALGEAAFDPSGRLAYVYYDAGSGLVRVAYDRTGDGDFNDLFGGVPELGTLTAVATPACLDASFDASGRLGVVYGVGGVTTLAYDRNGDRDFADANESQALSPAAATGCDLGTSASSGRLVLVHNPGGNLRLLVDLNDDADFLDSLESVTLLSPVAAPFAVTTTASGLVRVLAPQGVISGPAR